MMLNWIIQLKQLRKEAVKDEKGKYITFFKYGYNKNEKNILPSNLITKINSELKNEMEELSYL